MVEQCFSIGFKSINLLNVDFIWQDICALNFFESISWETSKYAADPGVENQNHGVRDNFF